VHRNDSLIAQLRSELRRTSPFQRILTESRLDITGLAVEARALVLATLQESLARRMAIIVPGDAAIDDFESALRLFHREPRCVSAYPSPSLSPYQELSPSLGVVREEIHALGMLVAAELDVLIVPARALFSRMPRPEAFAGRVVRLEQGTEIDTRAVMQTLVENGFVRTDLVGEAGEFAFRGGILDVFPPNLAQPLRIELFGDTIESLRRFDVETQRSEDEVRAATVLPMTQFAITRETRSALARRLSLDFMDPLFKRDVAEKIDRLNEHGTFPGIEHYAAAATDTIAFAEVIRDWEVVLVEPDQITTNVTKFEALLRAEYESSAEKGRAVYPPEKVTTPGPEVLRFLGTSRFSMSEVHVRGGSLAPLGMTLHAPQVDRYQNRLSEFASNVNEGHKRGRRQLFFTATKGGREKVERLLKEFEIPFADDSESLREEIVVTPGTLARGFEFEEINVTAYSEWDLFEPPTSTRIGGKKRTSDAFATDLRDLKIGDYIVHVDHGVGRFLGLQRIPFGETEREVMEIEYSGGGKLLMPMENLNRIQKYSGGGGDTQPKLDKLGGTAWARTKEHVKKAMRDMADELLKLYATRQMVQGHAFSKDSPWQFEFEEAFEFDETEDQHAAIDDVKSDMESRRPMDRLLCGDVGYGKTEVAMRAAFKSVMDGKQVAILAPTTILAEQHGRTFRERLADYPVKVEVLSRFRTPGETKRVVGGLERGDVDLVIGTHRLLSRDVRFHDLGLLIVDEEHRFGVRHKERLKALKLAVDVLTLTATPIPRTLHLSLAGLRDLTLLETPPKDRSPVVTFIEPWDDGLIEEALARELDRGGQVYFVHNRIETIDTIAERVRALAPSRARIAVAHGRLKEAELDGVMARFVRAEVDVLVSTMIVESGLDVPNANTMLVNRADQLGLAQLYQLRGRVGRSHRRAYCYLLVPDLVDADAEERLRVLEHHTDLGSGYRIALRDLELRGAGNLLGGEQSGHAQAVGFDMYLRWLQETVVALKNGERGAGRGTFPAPEVILDQPAHLPDSYVSDAAAKLDLYRRLARAEQPCEIQAVREELRDRFGPLPDEAQRLLLVSELRALGAQGGLETVLVKGDEARLTFRREAQPRLARLTVALDAVQFEAEVRRPVPLSLRLRRLGGEAIGPGLVRALTAVLHDSHA